VCASKARSALLGSPEGRGWKKPCEVEKSKEKGQKKEPGLFQSPEKKTKEANSC
jgi:hypothetical protein